MVQAAHHHGAHGHSDRPHEDWNDEDFVAQWLEWQKERAPERRRQFALVRSVIPKLPQQEFRYLNLGAGPGNLDEVLLEHFTGANAVLVDSSLMMLATARQQLARFGNRVEYVHANLATPDWAGAVSGPFDFIVSTHAIHHLEHPRRIRELYAEVHRLLGHGGTFLNFDIVRPARPSLAPLAAWAAQDAEAGIAADHIRMPAPGSLLEQLGWLSEAGFTCVDVLWKDLSKALVCGIRDHLHMPEGFDGGHAHGH